MDHISTNRRPRIPKKARGVRSKKLRWVECERLREIVPSVAKCKRIDEVRIIKEAIKHISRLEEAVIQRIAAQDLSISINVIGKRVADHLPSQIFLSIASHADVRLPQLTLNERGLSFFPLPMDSIAIGRNRIAVPTGNSTGTSPCWTDEENELSLHLTQD
ncbi:hypothetical protein FBUS_09710 [Fasciolopsis buskii]|uniref:BHLH domain-containing protein n=1 Tax=Fasciolopsis buskii TaxID=27845 RepID=A0A8E0S3M1_9TREM|nr:hypothetical protein FBUS_09710 [Fasciolopsis buski]